MASNANPNSNSGANAMPAWPPVIGPDGVPRESPAIAYAEKKIEEEQLQLRKYIDENYSKIRDVERELANLSMEMKLTSGSKKAAFEHMRKKIEMSNEKIQVAKLKEQQARKAWEEASKAVKEEEAIKQKLSEDLHNLMQESSNTQLRRLEELKRRLEALNPSRSTSAAHDRNSVEQSHTNAARDACAVTSAAGQASESTVDVSSKVSSGNAPATKGNQVPATDVGGTGKKKTAVHGRGRGIGAVPKGRGPAAPGWTGAGFDVDG